MQATVNLHVYPALFLGGLINALPYLFGGDPERSVRDAHGGGQRADPRLATAVGSRALVPIESPARVIHALRAHRPASSWWDPPIHVRCAHRTRSACLRPAARCTRDSARRVQNPLMHPHRRDLDDDQTCARRTDSLSPITPVLPMPRRFPMLRRLRCMLDEQAVIRADVGRHFACHSQRQGARAQRMPMTGPRPTGSTEARADVTSPSGV